MNSSERTGYLWRGLVLLAVWVVGWVCEVHAEAPGLAYVFPAGGRRGERVEVRFGGYYFHGQAGFSVDGRGFSGDGALKAVQTLFFDGPLILRPTSQQREDYPKDHVGVIAIGQDADVSSVLRAHTAEGVTGALRFVAGDFPELVEGEREGIESAVRVTVPVTVNGRMFPREDRDGWVFSARKGVVMSCEVAARSLGYAWQPVLELKGPKGLMVAGATWVQNRDGDSSVTFEVPEDGDYTVELRDAGYGGSQAHVYRLTVREGAAVTGIFPLGGRVGSEAKLKVARAIGDSAEIIQPILQEGLQRAGAMRELAGGWRVQGSLGGEVVRTGDGVVEGLEEGLLPVPAMVNGFIAAPGEHHDWRVRMGAGETLRLRVRAGSLGSKMDPVVSVGFEEGKDLAKNDDTGDGTTDAAMTYVAAKEGFYRVRVSDRFPQRHGLSHAYRMEVSKGGAISFGLRIASDFYNAVRSAPEGAPEPQGGKTPGKMPGLKVDLTESIGVAKEIALEIDGLPEGVTYEPKVIPAKSKGVEVRFSVPANTALQRVPIRVRGRVGEGDSAVVRDADVLGGVAGRVGTVLFAVVPRVPFRFIGEYMVVNDQPAGTTLKKTYRIDRGGYDGPLKVSLSDKQIRCLQRLQAKAVEVPRGAEFFDFEVLYPTEVQLGWTSRVQLMVTGEEAEPDGSRHLLTYTSSDTDDQMISIVTAGLLGVSGPRNSVLASPGMVEIPLRVRRHPSIEGRVVRVTLRHPSYVKGVKAIPLEIPAGDEDGVLRVEVAPSAGPFLMPFEVFAETDGPHHASMAVEFVSRF